MRNVAAADHASLHDPLFTGLRIGDLEIHHFAFRLTQQQALTQWIAFIILLKNLQRAVVLQVAQDH